MKEYLLLLQLCIFLICTNTSATVLSVAACRKYYSATDPNTKKSVHLAALKVAMDQPHRLVFLQSALSGARKIKPKDFKDLDRSEEIIASAATILWPLIFEEGIFGQELVAAFKQRTGSLCELALTEGKMTKAHRRLRQLRTIEYKGETVQANMNIKYGKRPGRTLRVYLIIDNASQKIVIAFIDPHLESYQTRRMK